MNEKKDLGPVEGNNNQVQEIRLFGYETGFTKAEAVVIAFWALVGAIPGGVVGAAIPNGEPLIHVLAVGGGAMVGGLIGALSGAFGVARARYG